jgi:hypothetical protein
MNAQNYKLNAITTLPFTILVSVISFAMVLWSGSTLVDAMQTGPGWRLLFASVGFVIFFCLFALHVGFQIWRLFKHPNK